MFVLDFVLPFLLGVFVTIGVAVALLLYWFYRQPLSVPNGSGTSKYVKPTSRKEVGRWCCAGVTRCKHNTSAQGYGLISCGHYSC